MQLICHAVFLATSFFTKSLSLLKSTETGTNLSISNLSTLDFSLAKSLFLANFNLPIPVAFFKPGFVALLDKSTLTLISSPKGCYGLGKY